MSHLDDSNLISRCNFSLLVFKQKQLKVSPIQNAEFDQQKNLTTVFESTTDERM